MKNNITSIFNQGVNNTQLNYTFFTNMKIKGLNWTVQRMVYSYSKSIQVKCVIKRNIIK